MTTLTLPRNYGGWTDKAFVTPCGLWIPKQYCTNWTEEKPPSEVDVELPRWFVYRNRYKLSKYK